MTIPSEIIQGAGTPNGQVTASPGAAYQQTDATTLLNVFWVKVTGTGNTGWAPLALIGSATLITASNASWPIPVGATLLEIICGGGGGGGGGGGSSSGVANQVGGAGAPPGMSTAQIVAVNANTTLAVALGAGGTNGVGGAAGGNLGTDGGKGGDTTVVGTGISCKAWGGGRGKGSAANSAASVFPVAFGSGFAGQTNGTNPGNFVSMGGNATSTNGNAGGDAIGYAGAAGSAGGPTSATLGGGAGTAGTFLTGGPQIGIGTSATTDGGTGSSAASNSGAGGGGGGGGAWNGGTGSGKGGDGGVGGSGFVIVRVVG